MAKLTTAEFIETSSRQESKSHDSKVSEKSHGTNLPSSSVRR